MSTGTGHKPPEGTIRRSQVLSSGGPGAVVDLPDYAVIIKGLDSWHYQTLTEGFFTEPRLEAKALNMLRGAGHWKHDHVRLRMPPACNDDSLTSRWWGMRAGEFPRWFQCRGCRGLVQRDALDEKRKHVCFQSGEVDAPAVPVRFVSACLAGHISDINWRFFAHSGIIDDNADQDFICVADRSKGLHKNDKHEHYRSDLSLISIGTSGDLSDLMVRCRRCGASRSLRDLRQPHALGSCNGWRPWLKTNEPGCTEKLKLLVRTGSNVWFPQRLSVLHIPDTASPLRSKVQAHWDSIGHVESTEELAILLKMPRLKADLEEAEVSELFEEVQRQRAGLHSDAEPIREAEWNELWRTEYGQQHDIAPPGVKWHARRIEGEHEKVDFIDRVVLVDTLKEVRAMVGFTRIEGVPVSAEGDIEVEGQRSAPLSENADWIPAVEINGEGIFIAFNEQAVRDWEALPAVIERAEQFIEAASIENSSEGGREIAFAGPRLVMLHSLAHMLITQISLECGYSASAIRERIYCFKHPTKPEESRAGILLYTGTPGSEGTLGGLVEVGLDIVRHLRQAVQNNLICSNDPVCAQHRPDGPEDGRRQEGAACHACLLIAEPSCERMNRDLDRALVVPTLESGDAAFLKGWV